MASGNQKLSQSPQRNVVIYLALVGLLASGATAYEYLHLQATDRLNGNFQYTTITLSVFLLCMVAAILISRGRMLRPAVWMTFGIGSLHLLSVVATALYLDGDIAIAVEHSVWILVMEVCLFATLARRVAFILSSILFGALLSIVGSFMFVQGIDLIANVREGPLVQLLVANAAVLVLLGGLSSFRELALIESARATASEEHAILLEASAQAAEADRKKAMEALKTAEMAAKARDSFLASMSHELRTPLNAIIGFSQILEMGDEGIANNSGKRKEYVADIRHSGEHMLTLVTQILEYSRLESEGCDLHPERISVPDIVTAAIRVVGVLAEKKHLLLLSQWDRRYKFEIETDECTLSQVLVNLLSNAVKFTPDGGLICVGIDFAGSAGVKIEVHDSGIGIPPEKLAHVRDPFFQVDDQRTTGTEGTGLGLSIVTSLVRELGGDFDIESTVGEGTCCRITLPLKFGAGAPRAEEPETPPIAASA